MQSTDLRLLSIVFGLVILSFVFASGYVGYRTRAIDQVALDISENTAPSILHLSSARREVRNLQMVVEHCLDDVGAGLPPSIREIAASDERIHQDVQLYRDLPMLPGERLLLERANREMIQLDDVVRHIVNLIMAHEFVAAKKAVDSELRQAILNTINGFMVIIEFDARQSSDRASRIGEMRAGLARISWILNLLCVLWTVVAAVVLGYSIQRHANLREAQRRRAMERADELELFAGRVAHDILIPLSVVSNTLQLQKMNRDGSEAQRKSLLARACANANLIQQILDGLLKFACAGAKPEPGGWADVQQVMMELAKELHTQASEARIALTMEQLPSASAACSPGILTCLVVNLVHNAIKYMGDGDERQIIVRVMEQGRMLRFEVEDTGPGLPPELEKVVFDPYVRARGTKQPGFGLGLATVKKAVEAHGGRVGVRSEVGRGSLFWFELPRSERVPPPGPISDARKPEEVG